MSKQPVNAPPWQAIEEQAYHAFREWPIWLILRERELAAHLRLHKVQHQPTAVSKPLHKEKSE